MPWRFRARSVRPRSGKVASNSTFRANGMPADPMRGFRRSLQIPVSVRWRISSPTQSCSPAPPTAAKLGCSGGSRISGQVRSTGPGGAAPASHVVRIRAAAVEEVEAEQLDALVLEIDERAVDAAPVRPEEAGSPARRGQAAPAVARRPVVRPVHPWAAPELHRPGAAAASGALLPDLAEESLGAVLRDRAEPGPHGPGASLEIGRRVAASGREQPQAQDESGRALPHGHALHRRPGPPGGRTAARRAYNGALAGRATPRRWRRDGCSSGRSTLQPSSS